MESSPVTRCKRLAIIVLVFATALVYRAYWTVGNNALESYVKGFQGGNDLLRTSLENFTLPQVEPLHEIKVLDLSEEKDCHELCQLKVQEYRKKILKDQCLALGYKENITYKNIVTKDLLKRLGHFLVSDKHKLIYCYIPKVGCTNWKRIFLVLEGVVPATEFIEQHRTHVLSQKHLKRLSGYKVEEAIKRLESFTLFVFVRNPFARLLSAYRDKLEGPTKNNYSQRRHWNRYIRLNLKNKSISFKENYGTFVRYVRYLSHHEVSDEHWNDMHKLSFPCLMKFDFIGKMETIGRDTNFVIDNILHEKKQNVAFHPSTNPTNSNDLFNQYFENLPRLDMISLYKRFRKDFTLFGYEMPKY